MTSVHFKPFRLVWLAALAALFAALLVVNVPAAHAADFILDWSAIGFVDGTSSLQTFTNVNNSGVDVTTEFRVLGAAFQDIGPYVPGTTPLNQGMPKPVNGSLGVRDINVTSYPAAGYIFTRITFSQNVQLNNLWMEAFFNWTDGGVRKNLALQAFDEAGNAVTPVDWTTYGGSNLAVQAHPDNGEPWLRSTYPDTQTSYSGASDIDYGTQLIRELHWYSWGLKSNGSLSNLLGSTFLGDIQFSVIPTAVSLVSAAAVSEPETLAVVLPAFLLLAFTTLFILRKRLILAPEKR